MVAALAAALGIAAGRPALALTDRVVTDPGSGLALGGVDPVSYFTDGVPREGKAELEMLYRGAFWRFRNAGNLAAFRDNPEVYAPRFGGYDPVEVAGGKTVAGKPSYWRIVDSRLYLFYGPETLAAFTADPERVLEDALKNWPEVEGRLLK